MKIFAKKLTNYPYLKRTIKNIYTKTGNLLSDKKSELEGLTQISSANQEHNFGYYDTPPWSKDQRYLIYLRPSNAQKNYVSTANTDIILYDTADGTEKSIAVTHVWNSQQGCMLQWLGPDFSSHILYNDFRDGTFCSVSYNISDATETVYKIPIYSVSADGKSAISLDFSRLNTFRPGYGYSNISDKTAMEKYPDINCIFKLDLTNNSVSELPITYKKLSEFMPVDSMSEGFHKVNHIMLNPSADRFMFIHRWIVDGVTHHRLLSCDTDGNDIYVILDDVMVSHCNWKDDEQIISYCYTEEYKDAYHILHDKSDTKEVICQKELTSDGHPSFSPNGEFIITDTYPDFKRKQALYLIRVSDYKVKKLGSIYSSIKYINETRCDLHPRWNYNSEEICIDASPKSKRQVYTLKVDTSFQSDEME